MPMRCATRVSSSGKKMENAATQVNRTSMMRRMARCRALEPPRISASDIMTTARTRTIWTIICTISPKKEISNDIDRVQQGLAFGFGIVGVDDFDRLFDPPGIHLGKLVDQFGGVRHPVLLQVEAAGHTGAEGPQSVVRIRQGHAGGKAGLYSGRTEDQPLHGGQLCPVIEEAGSQDDVGFARKDSVGHGTGVHDSVLAVGVESDDAIQSRVLKRILNARLERGPLAQVNGV